VPLLAARRPRLVLTLLLREGDNDAPAPGGAPDAFCFAAAVRVDTFVEEEEEAGWSTGANSCTQVTKISDTCRG